MPSSHLLYSHDVFRNIVLDKFSVLVWKTLLLTLLAKIVHGSLKYPIILLKIVVENSRSGSRVRTLMTKPVYSATTPSQNILTITNITRTYCLVTCSVKQSWFIGKNTGD